MMKFYETYRGQLKLATWLRELSWIYNLAIQSRSKRDEERKFYLQMAAGERGSFRDLQRQLNGALFERSALAPPKLSTPLAELHPEAVTVFKDTCLALARTLRGRLAARPGGTAIPTNLDKSIVGG